MTTSRALVSVVLCAVLAVGVSVTGYAQETATAALEAAYRKAADQGDADAQFYLGVLYEDGRGVPQDSAQAAIWYRITPRKRGIGA